MRSRLRERRATRPAFEDLPLAPPLRLGEGAIGGLLLALLVGASGCSSTGGDGGGSSNPVVAEPDASVDAARPTQDAAEPRDSGADAPEEDASDPVDEDTCPRETPTSGGCPSYANDVIPAIERNCIECHSANSGQPLIPYSEVETRLDFMEFALIQCVMPQNRSLPKSDADTLLSWLACGAPDN